MKTKVHFLLLCIILNQCSSLNTREPYFQEVQSQNLNTEYEIELEELGFYRKVNGDWWGEDFYVSTFKITNKTDMYKYFSLCYSENLDENNFNYTVREILSPYNGIPFVSVYNKHIKKDESTHTAYNLYPEKFDKKGFFKGFPYMNLVFEINDQNFIPKATFHDESVFPKVEGSKNEYLAAMTACKFGVPMSRDTDKAYNSTGWIPPKGSSKAKSIFSLPKGSKLVRFEQKGYYKANLTESNKTQ